MLDWLKSEKFAGEIVKNITYSKISSEVVINFQSGNRITFYEEHDSDWTEMRITEEKDGEWQDTGIYEYQKL